MLNSQVSQLYFSKTLNNVCLIGFVIPTCILCTVYFFMCILPGAVDLILRTVYSWPAIVYVFLVTFFFFSPLGPSALGQHYTASAHNCSVLTSALVNICIMFYPTFVLSFYLSFCPSVCLSVCLSLCLSLCLSVSSFTLNYWPELQAILPEIDNLNWVDFGDNSPQRDKAFFHFWSGMSLKKKLNGSSWKFYHKCIFGQRNRR